MASMRALRAVRFQKADIGKVQNFDCGDLEYQVPLADWIKHHSLEALDHRTKIWLFHSPDDNGVVGYGSLGKSDWSMTKDDGSEEKVKIFCIPTLAVQRSYWHKPETGNREERYSY